MSENKAAKKAVKTGKGKKEGNGFVRFWNGFKSFFVRVGHFFREVYAELRKATWPTRKDLITYTLTVIIFVCIMALIVFGMDSLFNGLLKLVLN